MNLAALHKIISATTVSFRKGDAVQEREVNGVKVREEYFMPHVDEAEGLEKVDVFFFVVGVDRLKADERREELVAILRDFPRMKAGPSYIEVGAEIGDQQTALRLFALGAALGLWRVVTPEHLGAKNKEESDALAGIGFVMTTGFNA